ncbi:hypothetical protein EV143_11292 [Flavobacterium chryseum]|uniref:hypothetical protein n=1 Tax=Flavobacterium sp. P3160 TaxID=2512113 RepID=UPI00105E04A7|nr:hypothetical protein [Flavobacterium sp. P3160]TDO70015.1 hypothetical protein EV143_11292 [Flavobacterium sp. P3160]
MKNFLLLLSILMLVITSCSNDENSSSSEDNSILPKTITYIYPYLELGSNRVSTLNYDGNKIVSIDEGGSRIKFTYDGDFIVKQEHFMTNNEGTQAIDNEISYSYENGKMKTRIFKEGITKEYPDGQYIVKIVYTHNSNELISFVNYSINKDTKAESKYSQGILTYKDGNLVKGQETTGSSVSTRVYEYDAKNNPLKNITGFNLLLNETAFSNSNVIKISRTETEFPNPVTYLNNHIYNDKNYPTKSTSLSSGGSIEYEIEYTY